MNEKRTFDDIQKTHLGKYIYALRDPRDRKIFYIGQGTDNRVFSHFVEADRVNTTSADLTAVSSKIIRIVDIWKHEEDVEWLILAHNLPTCNNIADFVESGIFDALSESQNGDTLNDVAPPNSSRLSPVDIVEIGAETINSAESINTVFIFPIQNALNSGTSIYNATRTAWYVKEEYRNLNPAFVVGLRNSISIGSFEIDSWNTAVIDPNKHEFTSSGHPTPAMYEPLLNKRWSKVLEQARGFWQRGNYLIIEFNGSGQFRIVRGSQDNTTWHACN